MILHTRFMDAHIHISTSFSFFHLASLFVLLFCFLAFSCFWLWLTCGSLVAKQAGKLHHADLVLDEFKACVILEDGRHDMHVLLVRE